MEFEKKRKVKKVWVPKVKISHVREKVKKIETKLVDSQIRSQKFVRSW